MASVACDSPVRRFTAKQNKENSPVDINRFKTLLKKKVGDDAGASGSSSASPKKAGTPRKEVKVKRDTTVKLCSSCADHNKDLDDEKIDAEAKKKRTKKTTDDQGQDANTVDQKTNAVEKKAAVKKPRETKKKAVAQGEMLDMPSTSGTAPSTSKGTMPTESGNQAEGESKPKRQRKNTDKSIQQAEPLVDKEKRPSRKAKKDIIQVKVALPKKTAKKMPAGGEKAPFANMDVTNLVNSTHHGEEAMQSSVEKSDDKRTKKNVHFEPPSNSTDSLTNESEILNNPSKSKKKTKNTDSTKSKIPRLKKTKTVPGESEKAPFENMDVTDLLNSTRQEEGTTKKSDSSTQKKPKKTVNVASTSSLTNVQDNLLDLPSSSSHEREVANNSQDMIENSSSTRRNNKDINNFSSSIEAEMIQMHKAVAPQRGTKGGSTSTKSNEISLTQADSSTNRDSSIDTMLHHEVHNPFDEALSDFNLDLSDNPMPTQVMTGVSTGENINLSASTNLSRDDLIEEMSMNISNEINPPAGNSFGKKSTLTSNIDALNIIDNAPAHSSIHHDETFPTANLPNDTVDRISQNIANVTLRTKKARKNKKNAGAAQNTSADGIISFTQNDSNRTMTDSAFNENDETFFDVNQQPSQDGIEHWTPIKSEPVDAHNGHSSNSVPNHNSSVQPHESSKLMKNSAKPASKSAEPKAKSKASKVLEPTEKKTKGSKKNESPKKASKAPAKKLVIPSPPKSKKKSKDDETLCEKHKNANKCDEKSARRTEKKRRLSKQVKADLKIAKAIEGMSHHFSRISIGTTIGTINELHIGLPSDSNSDSSAECSTDCSCNEWHSESSGDKCKCYRCVRKREECSSDSSESESSSDEDDSSYESSSTDSSSSSASTSSSNSSKEIRRPIKKSAAKRVKIVKPTFKEKLSKYCSRYDLRSHCQDHCI